MWNNKRKKIYVRYSLYSTHLIKFFPLRNLMFLKSGPPTILTFFILIYFDQIIGQKAFGRIRKQRMRFWKYEPNKEYWPSRVTCLPIVGDSRNGLSHSWMVGIQWAVWHPWTPKWVAKWGIRKWSRKERRR